MYCLLRFNNLSLLPPDLIPSFVFALSNVVAQSRSGMDAYCLLRFNYLCLRICLFSSFWGMLVLTPVYALEGSEEEGSIYYVTLANVPSGSNTLVGRGGRREGGRRRGRR